MEIGFETILGIAVGFLGGYLVSQHFYKKGSEDMEVAAQELRAEAEELRRLTTLALRGLEEAGLAKFNRDNTGKIKGLVINMSGHIQATSAISGQAEVIRPGVPAGKYEIKGQDAELRVSRKRLDETYESWEKADD